MPSGEVNPESITLPVFAVSSGVVTDSSASVKLSSTGLTVTVTVLVSDSPEAVSVTV